MKFLIILFALIALTVAAPQFGFSGSNAAANAQSGSFGGGFPGGISGSNAAASAQSGSFNLGFPGGISGSAANAQAQSFGIGK